MANKQYGTADRTKTNAARNIPIHPEVRTALEKIPRPLHTQRVFLRDGKPFGPVKHSLRQPAVMLG